MGRKKTIDHGSVSEPLKARITKTTDGFPVDLATARDAYGQAVMRTPDDGWFWIFASPAAARDIRSRGHRAIGTVTTTWIPPQSAIEVETGLFEAITPVVGTQEHADLMLRETRERESLS